MKTLSVIAFLALASAAAVAPAQSLPNRVASGDVTQFSAVLWARASVPGLVRFDIATNPQFQGQVRHAFDWVFDVTKPAKSVVLALHAGTTYHYRVIDAANASDSGTFRTAPLPWVDAPLRFGVSGDVRGELAPFRSISNAPAEHLDFFANIGDTIYADVASPILPGVNQVTSLAQYRAKHFEVYRATQGVNALGDLRASTSLLVTIDDHEVMNDFAGGAHPSSDPRFDQHGAFINDTNLFERGMQAFVEYNPILPTHYLWTGEARTAFERSFYRVRNYGRNASVFVLDARSFRDEELPGVSNYLDPNEVAAFQAAAFDPARTMLGHRQLDDLKDDLLFADQIGVRWKFVLVPEPIQNLGVVAAADRFEGYAAERTELLDFIATHGIDNVVFVAADIHGTIVNDISYQLGLGGRQIPTTAFEITTGAIAYDAPFGPTVISQAVLAGVVPPAQLALYNSLPLTGKDDFVRQFVDAQLLLQGLDPVGLSGSLVNATLLQGSWTATHVYGWTKFEIEARTGALTVTTYGLDPAQQAAPPAVYSRFVVTPR